jgi:hypothetical protein
MAGKEDGPLGCIRYAYECKVRSGRSAPLRRQLRSIVTRESGFVTALQPLVEHWNRRAGDVVIFGDCAVLVGWSEPPSNE